MAGGLPHGWLHGIGVSIAGAIHSGQQHGRCVRAERMQRWDLRWYHDPGSEKEVDFAPEISKGFPSKMMNLYWFILLSDCIYLHSDFPVPGEWIDVECLLLHLSSQWHFPLNSLLSTTLGADRWSGGWNREEEEEYLSSDAQVRPAIGGSMEYRWLLSLGDFPDVYHAVHAPIGSAVIYGGVGTFSWTCDNFCEVQDIWKGAVGGVPVHERSVIAQECVVGDAWQKPLWSILSSVKSAGMPRLSIFVAPVDAPSWDLRHNIPKRPKSMERIAWARWARDFICFKRWMECFESWLVEITC